MAIGSEVITCYRFIPSQLNFQDKEKYEDYIQKIKREIEKLFGDQVIRL